MKEYEVWIEGYVATGESEKAYCYGTVKANSFEEACIKLIGDQLAKDENEPDGYGRHGGKLNVWARRCFDNEADARKSFG